MIQAKRWSGRILIMCVLIGMMAHTATNTRTGEEIQTSGWFVNADSSSDFDDSSDSPVRIPSSLPDDLDADELLDLLADQDEFEGAEEIMAAPAKQGKKEKGNKGSSSGTGNKKNKKSNKVSSSSPSSSDSSTSPPPPHPSSLLHPFSLYEYVGLSLVLLSILNYFFGSWQNKKIALKVGKALGPLLESQFELVGEEGEPDVAVFTPVSPHTYTLYCTGRRGCSGMLITLRLRRRQDILSRLLEIVDMSPSRDSAIFEASLGEDDGPTGIPSPQSAPFIFAAVPKKRSKRLLKEELLDLTPAASGTEGVAIPQLATLVKAPTSSSGTSSSAGSQQGAAGIKAPTSSSGTSSSAGSQQGAAGIHDKFLFFSEVSELVSELFMSDRILSGMFSNPSVQTLNPWIETSDQVSLPWSTGKRTVRGGCELTSAALQGAKNTETSAAPTTQGEAFPAVLRTTLHLVDLVSGSGGNGGFTLSAAQALKSAAKRQKHQEASRKLGAAAKQEEMARRKEEQRRKEEEVIAANPKSEEAREILRKREQKEAKLAKKQRGQNVKVMR